MKRFTPLVLLVSLCLIPVAHADDASHRAKAKELLVLLHIEKLSQEVMQSVLHDAGTRTVNLPASVTPEQRARLSDLQLQAAKVIENRLSWRTVEPNYIDLYTQIFSEPELDGILAFYKSPPGKAMIERSPALTALGLKLVQSRMLEIEPSMRKLNDEYKKDVPSAVIPASGPAKVPVGPPTGAPSK